MDTSRLVVATSFHRLAVGLVFDPSAPDPAEAWVATIGLDIVAAGPTAEEALAEAMNREALGPEPICHDSDDDLEPLPFTDEPDVAEVPPARPSDDWRAAWSMRLA